MRPDHRVLQDDQCLDERCPAGVAFGLQLLLVAGVAMGGLLGLRSVRRAYQSAIDQGLETARLAAELGSELLEARRAEQEFFARWQGMGYESAHGQFVSAHQQHLARIRAVIAALEAVGSAAGDADTATRITGGLVIQY